MRHDVDALTGDTGVEAKTSAPARATVAVIIAMARRTLVVPPGSW